MSEAPPFWCWHSCLWESPEYWWVEPFRCWCPACFQNCYRSTTAVATLQYSSYFNSMHWGCFLLDFLAWSQVGPWDSLFDLHLWLTLHCFAIFSLRVDLRNIRAGESWVIEASAAGMQHLDFSSQVCSWADPDHWRRGDRTARYHSRPSYSTCPSVVTSWRSRSDYHWQTRCGLRSLPDSETCVSSHMNSKRWVLLPSLC